MGVSPLAPLQSLHYSYLNFLFAPSILFSSSLINQQDTRNDSIIQNFL